MRNMKRRIGLYPNACAKLAKGDTGSMTIMILVRVAQHLNCQPGKLIDDYLKYCETNGYTAGYKKPKE